MRRVRAGVIAGLGLFGGPALAEEIGWRPVAPIPVPAGSAPVYPVPAATITSTFGPASAGEPTRNAPPPGLISGEPRWQPARLLPPIAANPEPTSTPAPIALPAGTSPLFHAVSAKQIPSVEAPPPRPVDPLPSPRPLPTPAPIPEIAPAPKSTQLLPPESAPDPLSAQVWGSGPFLPADSCAGNSCPDGVAPAGFARPVRKTGPHSPNLTLSRDHHFLDIFGVGVFADEPGTQIVGEGPATDRFFVSGEYLLWWVNPGNIPVLASTSNNGNFGFLGQPGTQTLLGPGQFGPTLRDGFRVRAGAWLDECGTCGIDGSFFFLGSRGESFAVNSNQFPTITRPIFAPNIPGEFGELVSFPGLSTGVLVVDTDSQLWGADVNFRKAVCRTCTSRSEWFAGFRYLDLKENLRITEFITAVANSPQPTGTQIVVRDSFGTHNQFYGGQIGWLVGRSRGRWDFDARLSLAMGVTHQTLTINGVQSVTQPGAPEQLFVGGLLAAGPNIGTFTKDRFSVVPEATFTAGYRLTPNLRATLGYNFLYWSNVIRPGDQIDRVVDLTFVPNSLNVPFSGVPRPQPTFKSSDLFVHGIQFGIEYRW